MAKETEIYKILLEMSKQIGEMKTGIKDLVTQFTKQNGRVNRLENGGIKIHERMIQLEKDFEVIIEKFKELQDEKLAKTTRKNNWIDNVSGSVVSVILLGFLSGLVGSVSTLIGIFYYFGKLG